MSNAIKQLLGFEAFWPVPECFLLRRRAAGAMRFPDARTSCTLMVTRWEIQRSMERRIGCFPSSFRCSEYTIRSTRHIQYKMTQPISWKGVCDGDLCERPAVCSIHEGVQR